MLSINTPIATAVRGQVRAYIKGQAGFANWLLQAHGISETRLASNAHLLEYAISAGLDAQVEAIMQGAPVPYTMQTIARNAQEGENVEAALMGRQAAPTPSQTIEGEMVLALKAKPAVSVLDDMVAILAPVEPFLSPLVKSELEKALAPLIIAANKPAVEIERIVTVTQAPLPVGATPYATKGKQVPLGSLFGFRGQYAKAPVSTWDAHGAAPAIDPFYVTDPYNMFMLATAIERGSNVWLGGPSGTGKSTMPEQFCAHVGRPCITLSFTKQTEVADMVGGPAVLTDGSTAWQDGVLVQAIKRPGMVIVLDELSMSGPGIQAIFQSLASDQRSLALPTGEIVHCAQGVVFVTADNTFGFGDETGQFAGTHACNGALVNRFKRVLKVDYISKADESRALANHTGCPKPAADSLADFVHRARKMPEMENVPLSLRQMVGFVQAIEDGASPTQAAQVAFLNRMPAAERAALETLFTLAWAKEFEGYMRGVQPAQPAKPIDASSPQAAFDDEASASYVR